MIRGNLIPISALLGWPMLVAVAMVSLNLRTYTGDVFVGYNSADYFEFETRLARGWPFALASLDQNAAKWQVSELRLVADGLVA